MHCQCEEMTVDEPNIKISTSWLVLGCLAANSDLVIFFLRQAEQIALQRGKKQCYGAKLRVTLMSAFCGI